MFFGNLHRVGMLRCQRLLQRVYLPQRVPTLHNCNVEPMYNTSMYKWTMLRHHNVVFCVKLSAKLVRLWHDTQNTVTNHGLYNALCVVGMLRCGAYMRGHRW